MDIYILEENVEEVGKLLFKNKWVFQQDGASSNRALKTKKWLHDNYIQVMDLLAISPELNVIENIWGWVGRKI